MKKQKIQIVMEKKKKKTQTVMKYQETSFGLPLPTLPFKPKASSHQALFSIF